MTACPSTTGDVRNSLWAARSALKRLRAPAEVVEAGGLLHGEPSTVLRALRFVFNRYPRALERCATAAAVGGGACCASELDATAAAASAASAAAAPCCSSSSSSVPLAGRALLSAACPPARFATAAVRALRHGLGIARVGLTPAQLLERGYAERKLILISEAATAARELEAQGAAAARRGCDGGGARQKEEKKKRVVVVAAGWPIAAGARGPGARAAPAAASEGPSTPVEEHFERSLRSEGRRAPAPSAPAPAPVPAPKQLTSSSELVKASGQLSRADQQQRRRRPLPPPLPLSSDSEGGGDDLLPRRAPPPRPLALPPAAFRSRAAEGEAREEVRLSESDGDDDGEENDHSDDAAPPLSKKENRNNNTSSSSSISCPVRRAEAAAARAVSALVCLGERVAALEGAVLKLRAVSAPLPPRPPPPPQRRRRGGRGFSDDDDDDESSGGGELEAAAPRSPRGRRHDCGGFEGSIGSSHMHLSPLREKSSGSSSRSRSGARVPRLCLPPPPPSPPPPQRQQPQGTKASSLYSNSGSGGNRDFASGSEAFVAALEARAEAARSWLEAVSRVE